MKSTCLRLAMFVCVTVTTLMQAQERSGQVAGECENAVTTAAMRTCEASRYAATQQALDSAYRSLMEHLDPGQKQKLRLTQRAWIRFRDANADFQASLEQGGTLEPLVRIGSLTQMTKARAEELKKEALP